MAGLRASEIRGLPWGGIDFDNRVIRVRQRADTSGRIGPPKSASSRRDIPMPPGLVAALKEWRLASGGRDGLVFPGRDGRPLCHNTLRLIAGRLHRLRHWYASWLIDQGFDAKKIQTYMGHASVAQTYNTYGHLLDRGDDHDKLSFIDQNGNEQWLQLPLHSSGALAAGLIAAATESAKRAGAQTPRC
jgi:integrase